MQRPYTAVFKHSVGRAAAYTACAGAVVSLPLWLSDFRIFQINLGLTYAMALLGLNVLTGWSGQLSLGHGGLFALGAYLSGALTQHLGLPWMLTLPCAALLGASLGWLIGLPALRLGGHELALATFALALAVPHVLKHPALSPWTGGAQGLILTRPTPPSWLEGWGLTLHTDSLLLWVLLGILAGGLLLVRRITQGSLGLAWQALRDHRLAAQVVGLDPAHDLTVAFAWSAGITALGGACYAQVVGLLTPESFPAFFSLSLLVGLVVGGLGWLPGCFVGAAFMQGVPLLTDRVSLSAPWVLYGLTLITVLWIIPQGAAGLMRLRFPRRARQRGITKGESTCDQSF